MILYIILTIVIICTAAGMLLFFMTPAPEIIMPDCADALPGEKCWKELTAEPKLKEPTF